jgi:hypothetical protein
MRWVALHLSTVKSDLLVREFEVFMPKSYTNYVDEMADKYGVPRSHVRAIYENETASGKNVRSSSAGAQGHMQLMPGTAKEMGVADIADPYQNIEGGVKYYAKMLKKFGDPVVAAAAYNAGPGNVRKYGGVPPFAETKNYVRKFVKLVGAQDLMGEPNTEVVMSPKKETTTKVAMAAAPVSLAPQASPEDVASQFSAIMATLGKGAKKTKRDKLIGLLSGI